MRRRPGTANGMARHRASRAHRPNRRLVVLVVLVVAYVLALTGVFGTLVQTRASGVLDGVVASVLVLHVPRFVRGDGHRAER